MSALDCEDFDVSQQFDIGSLSKMNYEKIKLPSDVFTNFVNALMWIMRLLVNLQKSVHPRIYDDVGADVLYALVAVMRDDTQKKSKKSFCKELFKSMISEMIQSTTYDNEGCKYFVFCDTPAKSNIHQEMYDKFRFTIMKPEMLADVVIKLMTLHIRMSKLNKTPIKDIRRQFIKINSKLPKDEQTQIYFDEICTTTYAILSML
jgi:hypothetical protein